MKTTRFLLVLGVTMLLTSCAMSTYETRYRYDENTASYINTQMQPTYVIPTVADLEISPNKIVESQTFDNTLKSYDISHTEASPTLEYWKSLTVSKAVQAHNADVIVAPIFDIKTSDNYATVTVTVSGYPAKYKNFRNMSEKDADAFRVYGIEIEKIENKEIIVPVK